MQELDELVQIMARLRGPQGCPWDRQQTHETLKTYLLEEAYELLEAVDSGEPSRICAELGDLMLIAAFFGQLGSEAGLFDLRDSLRRVNEKLRYRHPHVFGDVEVSDADEVLVNWERLKRHEAESGARESVLDGVPATLPALQRAQELQKRASRVGFDWENARGAREKVLEELGELDEASAEPDPGRAADELGDLLFAVVNVGRLLGLEAEDALRGASGRFSSRFTAIERRAAELGRTLTDMTLEEMDALWDEVKAAQAGGAHARQPLRRTDGDEPGARL